MKFLLCFLLATSVCCAQQSLEPVPAERAAVEHVPGAMRGAWVIKKQLTGDSLGCFDPEHAHGLVGVKFTLTESGLNWNGHKNRNLQPQERRVSGYEFEARYGQKPRELGLAGDPIMLTQVVPTFGIPVNLFLLRDPATLLIDACNIWLEAVRVGAEGSPDH